MRVSLINPHWPFEASIYFGCREHHLPIEFGVSKQLLEAGDHQLILAERTYRRRACKLTARLGDLTVSGAAE